VPFTENPTEKRSNVGEKQTGENPLVETKRKGYKKGDRANNNKRSNPREERGKKKPKTKRWGMRHNYIWTGKKTGQHGRNEGTEGEGEKLGGQTFGSESPDNLLLPGTKKTKKKFPPDAKHRKGKERKVKGWAMKESLDTWCR